MGKARKPWFMRLWFILAVVGALSLGLSWFYFSCVRSIEVQYPDNTVVSVGNQFQDTSGRVGDYRITVHVSYFLPFQCLFHLIPDDRVMSIQANGLDLPIDQIPEASRGDFKNGFIYDIGSYVGLGDHSIVITVRNSGGPGGLRIFPLLAYVWFGLFMLLACLVIVLLLVDRDLSSSGAAFDIRVVIFVASVLAFAVRAVFMLNVSLDYEQFLGPWINEIAQKGFSSLSGSFSDYAPLYLYLMFIGTLLPTLPLITIKLWSVLMDYVLAAVIFKLVAKKYPEQPMIPAAAFMATLFLPTVLLNGSFWGQCDVILAALVLLTVFFLSEKRPWAAAVVFGIAFSFKLQVVFFAPVLLLLWWKKQFPLPAFLLAPAIYLVTMIPSILVGRPVTELLMIYLNQTSSYGGNLTLNCPTFYQWLPNRSFYFFAPGGVILAGSIVLGLIYFILRQWKGLEFNLARLVRFSMLFTLAVPFFLPKMHERYFFTADVVALVFAFFFPKRFWVPIVVGLASLFSYSPFLFGQPSPVDMKWLSIALLGVIVVLVKDIIEDFRSYDREKLDETIMKAARRPGNDLASRRHS